jgi:quercetin dioxygenase-like cupin family protein
MMITRNGSQASITGPADWFSGTVRINPLLLKANAPSRVTAARFTFEPGARIAWHTHPLGQPLIVAAGLDRVQRQGGPIEDIRPGYVVWFSLGEKHRHGASPDSGMTHIAIQEELDGSAVERLEKISEAQYGSSHQEHMARRKGSHACCRTSQQGQPRPPVFAGKRVHFIELNVEVQADGTTEGPVQCSARWTGKSFGMASS